MKNAISAESTTRTTGTDIHEREPFFSLTACSFFKILYSGSPLGFDVGFDVGLVVDFVVGFVIGLRVVGFVVGFEVTKKIYCLVEFKFENLPFEQIIFDSDRVKSITY